jgi:hypothetical protein
MWLRGPFRSVNAALLFAGAAAIGFLAVVATVFFLAKYADKYLTTVNRRADEARRRVLTHR